MNGRSIIKYCYNLSFDVIIALLFVLHVEANLNSQRHKNAHLTTKVSFLKGDFFPGHTVVYCLSLLEPTTRKAC